MIAELPYTKDSLTFELNPITALNYLENVHI